MINLDVNLEPRQMKPPYEKPRSIAKYYIPARGGSIEKRMTALLVDRPKHETSFFIICIAWAADSYDLQCLP